MKQSNELTFSKPLNAWHYDVKDIDEAVGTVSITKGEGNKGYIAFVWYREEEFRDGKKIPVKGYGEKWARKAWDERIQMEQQQTDDE